MRRALPRPLDRNAVLKSVAKTGRLLIADEDYLGFGLSGEISAIVAPVDGRIEKILVKSEETFAQGKPIALLKEST